MYQYIVTSSTMPVRASTIFPPTCLKMTLHETRQTRILVHLNLLNMYWCFIACFSFDVHLLSLVIRVNASCDNPSISVTWCAHWWSCCVIICLCSWATHLAHCASPENQGRRRPEGHDRLSHVRCTQTCDHLDPRWWTNSFRIRGFEQWHFIDRGRALSSC